MTATMARLVLAMLLLPATGAVFLLSFFALIRPAGPPGTLAILIVWLIVYTFVAAYWVLLWRNAVRWTAARIGRTAIVSGLALLLGAAIGVLLTALAPWAPGQVVILVGGGTVPITWVLGTVIVWRESPRERAERLGRLGASVLCPLCGYNLAGLREARCPECGGAFTLDQLAAAQPRPAAEAAEL